MFDLKIRVFFIRKLLKVFRNFLFSMTIKKTVYD